MVGFRVDSLPAGARLQPLAVEWLATGRDSRRPLRGWLEPARHAEGGARTTLHVAPVDPFTSVLFFLQYLVSGRLRNRHGRVGDVVTTDTGQSFTVYRETTLRSAGPGRTGEGAVLVFRFHLWFMPDVLAPSPPGSSNRSRSSRRPSSSVCRVSGRSCGCSTTAPATTKGSTSGARRPRLNGTPGRSGG